MNNPKLTNVLLVALIAINVLLFAGWTMHRHHRNHERMWMSYHFRRHHIANWAFHHRRFYGNGGCCCPGRGDAHNMGNM